MEIKQKHLPAILAAVVALFMLVGAAGFFAGRWMYTEDKLSKLANSSTDMATTLSTTKTSAAPTTTTTTVSTTAAPTTVAPTTTVATTTVAPTSTATPTTVAPTTTATPTTATEATTVAPETAAPTEAATLVTSEAAKTFLDSFVTNYQAGGKTLTFVPEYKPIVDELFLKAFSTSGLAAPGIRDYAVMAVQEDKRIPYKFGDAYYKEPGHVWTAEDGKEIATNALEYNQNLKFAWSILDGSNGSILFLVYTD